MKGPGGSRGQCIQVDQIDQVRAELDNYAQFAALVEDYVEINEELCKARVGPPPPRRSRQVDHAAPGGEKGGVRDREELTALADRVAVWAAEEARRLVHTAAGLVPNGESQPR